MPNLPITSIQQFLPTLFTIIAVLIWGGFLINFYISRWLTRTDENFAKLNLLERFLYVKKYLKENNTAADRPNSINLLLRVDKLINYVVGAFFILYVLSLIFLPGK